MGWVRNSVLLSVKGLESGNRRNKKTHYVYLHLKVKSSIGYQKPALAYFSKFDCIT